MTPARALAATLEAFIAVLAAFAAHRFLAFAPLAGGLSLTSPAGGYAFLVGLLSDTWVAFLVAAASLAADGVLALLGWPGIARLTRLLLLLGCGLAAALDQAYAERFHGQLSDGQLVNLFDPEAAAVGASLAGSTSLLVLLVLVLVGLALLRSDPFEAWSARGLAVACAVVAAGSLVGHNRNILWRDQREVPAGLRVNALEHLFGGYPAAEE